MAAFKSFGINMLNWLKAAMFNLASVNVVVCSCVQVFVCLSAFKAGLLTWLGTRTPEHLNTETLEHPNTQTLRKLFFLAILLLSFAASAQSKILSPHGPLKWECESCHTPRSFYKLKNPPDFDHKETGFLLLGKHEFAPCAGCHQEVILSRVASACADCHNDVHRGQFGFDCRNCHSSDSWENNRNILGIHAARGFALVGVHAMIDCQACHIDEQRNEFTLTPTECATCHIGDYLATSNPNHIAAGFGLDCRSCHVLLAVSWEYLNFFETQANLKLNGTSPRRVLLDRIRETEE